MIIRNFRNDERSFYTAFLLLVYALVSKVGIVAIDALVFSNSPDLVTISPGTESYLMIVVILFGFTSLRAGGGFRLGQKLFLLAMIALTLSYYVFTAGRGRIVVGIISFMFFLFEIKAKNTLVSLVLMIIALLAIFPFIPEQYTAYLAWKLDSFDPSVEGGESSLVRQVSLQNILAEQLHFVHQFFVGTGLGGYFTSQYVPFPFNLTGNDAFADEWIKNDTFYKPHGSLMFLLLKTGTVGFCFIYGSVAYNNIKSLAAMRRHSRLGNASARVLIVVLPVILPLMLVNFSSKLQLLTGMLLGFSYFGLRFYRADDFWGKSLPYNNTCMRTDGRVKE